MSNTNDWRITNQHKYLYGKSLVLKAFRCSGRWDHEHCVFCYDKILPGNVAYCTVDNKYWICKQCFDDFKKEFGLNIIAVE